MILAVTKQQYPDADFLEIHRRVSDLDLDRAMQALRFPPVRPTTMERRRSFDLISVES